MQIKYTAIAKHQQKRMTEMINFISTDVTDAVTLKEKIEQRFVIIFPKLTLTVAVEEVKKDDEVEFVVTIAGKPIV